MDLKLAEILRGLSDFVPICTNLLLGPEQIHEEVILKIKSHFFQKISHRLGCVDRPSSGQLIMCSLGPASTACPILISGVQKDANEKVRADFR